MTENEIHKWISLGMDIGAHTKTHTDLTKISQENAASEINDCKAKLEKKFKISVSAFCYPFGRFNKEVCNLTMKGGFSNATTMVRGRANRFSDRFQLPRIPITHHTLPHLFLAKILTNYEDKRK